MIRITSSRSQAARGLAARGMAAVGHALESLLDACSAIRGTGRAG